MKIIDIFPLRCGFIFVLSLFLFLPTGCLKESESIYGPPLAISPLVVSYHDQGVEAGNRILNSGGNAFDAFVATVVAEIVVSPGAVTLAGLMCTLLYHAESNAVSFLDSGYNSVLAPDGEYDPSNPILGKLVAVPGIVAGLEAVHRRYGRLNWQEILQPAIELARDGFPISEVYSRLIGDYKQLLQSTEYGRQTFFPGGAPLQAGDILKQPELAEFLSRLAEQGASYMYAGEWAEQCVETVQAEGGLMTREDLASYQPIWGEPWIVSYRGYDICASAGRVMHGLWALLALKTLEHTSLNPLIHYSESADALEVLVRIARAVDKEAWIGNHWYLDDRDLVNSRLTWTYTNLIWEKVRAALDSVSSEMSFDNETLCSAVVDSEGNVAAAKHSINSYYWGSGLFVQGIPLNASGMFKERWTGPGERRLQGAPNFFVFKDGKMRSILGTWGDSNHYTAFQFLADLIDYELPADQAITLPRFGSYYYDENGIDLTKNVLDERVSQEIVDILRERGLFFSQESSRVGIGCLIQFHPDGSITTGMGR
jgi:gamma-glutamyltranspeptidase/glutathione hydrolase